MIFTGSYTLAGRKNWGWQDAEKGAKRRNPNPISRLDEGPFLEKPGLDYLANGLAPDHPSISPLNKGSRIHQAVRCGNAENHSFMQIKCLENWAFLEEKGPSGPRPMQIG
jgi:hypothetical protein